MGNAFSVVAGRTAPALSQTNADNSQADLETSNTSKILDYPHVLGSEKAHDARRHTRGYWVGRDTSVLHDNFTDCKFGEQIPKFLKQEKCSSVIDVGAGNGAYAQAIANSGIFVNCYDGNPNTQSLSQGRCSVLDFSQSLNLPCQYDWVLSIRVGKHIPKEFEETFFQNMHRLAKKGVIINWGGSTEKSASAPADANYFNEHPDTYIIDKFTQLGYAQDLKAQEMFECSAKNKTLKERLLVFRKVH